MQSDGPPPAMRYLYTQSQDKQVIGQRAQFQFPIGEPKCQVMRRWAFIPPRNLSPGWSKGGRFTVYRYEHMLIVAEFDSLCLLTPEDEFTDVTTTLDGTGNYISIDSDVEHGVDDEGEPIRVPRFGATFAVKPGEVIQITLELPAVDMNGLWLCSLMFEALRPPKPPTTGQRNTDG